MAHCALKEFAYPHKPENAFEFLRTGPDPIMLLQRPPACPCDCRDTLRFTGCQLLSAFAGQERLQVPCSRCCVLPMGMFAAMTKHACLHDSCGADSVSTCLVAGKEPMQEVQPHSACICLPAWFATASEPRLGCPVSEDSAACLLRTWDASDENRSCQGAGVEHLATRAPSALAQQRQLLRLICAA